MILLVGDGDDPVIVLLRQCLQHQRQPWTLLDVAQALPADLQAPRAPGAPWRLGAGARAVGAVFVRPGRTVSAARQRSAQHLWQRIHRALLACGCPVMNPLDAGAGNYAKVHQMLALARAGFVVPATLVTSRPLAALQFIAAHQGRVLTKGLSNAKTLPQVVGPEHLARIAGVRQCPAQFQEIVRGRELRVSVIGMRAIASVARRRGGGYHHVDARHELPADVVQRCVDFVAAQQLLLGGFDLCVADDGSVYCFEMNHTPLLSHYDGSSPSVLTRAVARWLCRAASPGSLLA